MTDPSVELETAILTALSQSNRPLKARAIAALVSATGATVLHKRDINPMLYRMLANGRLSRGAQFRWSLRPQSVAIAVSPYPTESVRSGKRSYSINEVSSAPLGLVEQHPTRDKFEKNPIVDLPETRVDDEGILKPLTRPSPEDRVFGNLHVRREKRPYERHCTWCLESIPERQIALVVDGARKRRPRFCSDDCFQLGISVLATPRDNTPWIDE
jgi:hypothetical protein